RRTARPMPRARESYWCVAIARPEGDRPRRPTGGWTRSPPEPQRWSQPHPPPGSSRAKGSGYPRRTPRRFPPPRRQQPGAEAWPEG
ncbi:hypothetical protein, partial [Acinetobacter baumannii]|uniref:hypothetical protein n=1 Tax=Acinetobacter baumannii TaxID=470 RepID=UPI001BB46F44